MTQTEIPTQYEPDQIQGSVYQQWLDSGVFAARPEEGRDPYVIMMPLPNVTGALHMGHAMDNVMQDLLIRWHRMQGEDALWMPGTDHAGIATQAVVEKRLRELEGKTRHDIGREELVKRIWDWKDRYEARIISQQQAMGCSCDWDRHRFTMDEVCTRAVRWTFWKLFQDGLIYRGKRMVNWDCHLQTAVADDEIYHETTPGHFWHLRYPVVEPRPGEPEYVVVATTRPETMLGDTAVACHPDPESALAAVIEEARSKLAAASEKERPVIEEELNRLEGRRKTHLPGLLQLAEMAREGRQVRLPLLDRPLPLVLDSWAKPELGSGCVKITPGHDPNDYEVWQRHPETIGMLDIMHADGSMNEWTGSYAGLDRFEARSKVVGDLEKLGLLDRIEEREVEIAHSDRSKTPIEPRVSPQWFVRMGDVPGGVVFGGGTEKEWTAPGLAQAAMDAANGSWRSVTGRQVAFHPDDRYGRTYLSWLGEKRDWCISRQLWWGHQIPIWHGELEGSDLENALLQVESILDREGGVARIAAPGRESFLYESSRHEEVLAFGQPVEVLVCLRDLALDREFDEALTAVGLAQDPDVLDTWFSSAIWPHSTLGWPDPQTAPIREGQTPTGGTGATPDALASYYPGSCLVTGRDIITLWVARMVVMGLYNLGDVPFTDVFLHANILDGKGERMSKSKGNGIDPLDIIEQYGVDAMRYVLCDMQTGSQDIRLPVQAISPFTGNPIDLAKAKRGQTLFSYICPESGKEFDVLGTMPDLPSARLVSDRFEIGKNFCNKLWNAARFALLNLEEVSFEQRTLSDLADEDRWILSRLVRCVRGVQSGLEEYNPSVAIGTAREFFWNEMCDWYLEIVKPRMRDPQQAPLARQVLATLLDQVLRLFHPFVPFVTEALWKRLGERAPQRGITAMLETPEQIVRGAWPRLDETMEDSDLEERFSFFQEVIRCIRDIRAKYGLSPSSPLVVSVRAQGDLAEWIESGRDMIGHMAGLESMTVGAEIPRSADAAVTVVRDIQVHVHGVVDLEKEKNRLGKERDKLVKRVEGSRKKLANDNFVQRAKPEVVAQERERLLEMERQLETIGSSLADLEIAFRMGENGFS
ncbi:MAG: valine--tRNA ligase [Planctomycetota bacterium]|nr:valine--tRNA ligase [Planctomycetota bacterium]